MYDELTFVILSVYWLGCECFLQAIWLPVLWLSHETKVREVFLSKIHQWLYNCGVAWFELPIIPGNPKEQTDIRHLARYHEVADCHDL